MLFRSEEAKRSAKKIFAVIDKYHWMLVTLLFCNAVAMEALPLFLNKVVSPAFAIVISVTAVLVFGEIVPQALCTGESQIKIAVVFCPIVTLLMWLTFPVSWPIGKLLDKLMGEHTVQRYDNDQLRYLILLHSKQALEGMDHLAEDVQGLENDQARMIAGALQFTTAKTSDIMTDMHKVQVFTLDTVLNRTTLEIIR